MKRPFERTTVNVREEPSSGTPLAWRSKIGSIAKPDDVIFAADLPKTRSGKIMRRLRRDIAEGKALGDTTTPADPSVLQKLKTQYEEEP